MRPPLPCQQHTTTYNDREYGQREHVDDSREEDKHRRCGERDSWDEREVDFGLSMEPTEIAQRRRP